MDFATDRSGSNTGNEGSQKLRNPPNSSPDDRESWEALDFILALEWPCRNHIHHHAINPLSVPSSAEAAKPSHNHALTATQTVYSCALEPSPSHPRKKSPEWHLPYSEIEKYVNTSTSCPAQATMHSKPRDRLTNNNRLITLSSQLPVNDDMMTPAQIYSTICLEIPPSSSSGTSSRGRVMEALKVPLSRKVTCYGFGAALPAVDFYAVFDSAVRGMRETSNTYGQ